MKKILLSTLMLFAAITATFAQHSIGSMNIAPKVGVNIASLTKNGGGDPRWGFVGGAEFEYQATDIFSLTAGVLYSMEGAKNKDSNTTLTTKLDYINVPILANVYVAKGLAVKLGVQPEFNVKSEFNASYGSSSASEDFDAKGVCFSIPVGMSYEFSGAPVVIDARYNWGLTKVVDGSDCKNSVFQVTLGYKFSL